MPQFNITSPTGEKYLITAPEGATEQDAINYAQIQFTQQPEKPTSSMLGAGYRGIEQGLTNGFGDEAKAGIGALIAKSFGGEATQNIPMGELYNQSLSAQNQQLKQDYQQQPTSATVGNIVGGIGGIIGGGKILGAGAKAIESVAPSALNYAAAIKLSPRAKDVLLGITQGGIAGAGTADTTAGQSRSEGALGGAVVGGITAPVIGGAISGISNALKNTANPISQQMSNMIKPIRLSAADLGDAEAKSIFNLAKAGKLGEEASTLANNFAENQSKDFADNFASLYAGNPRTDAALGEGLSKRLLDAKNNAYMAKSTAYKEAEPALKTASIAKENLLPLIKDLQSSIKDFDPELVPNVKGITKNIGELNSLINNKSIKDIKLYGLETLRKRIGNLPVNDASSAAVVSKAKNALDNFSNDILEQGLINGDKGAINLIKDARKANAYWAQNFSSKNANATIRKFVQNEGENLTNEQLLNKFLSVSESGLDGIQSAKDILGNDAQSILREGFLNKIYNGAVTKKPVINEITKQIEVGADGLPLYKDVIQPEKLDNAIKNVIKDKQFLKEAGFTENDFKTLSQLQSISKQIKEPIDKSNPSGSGNKLIDFIKNRPLTQAIFKTPLLGNLAEGIANKQSASKVNAIINNQQKLPSTSLYGQIQGLNKGVIARPASLETKQLLNR